MGYLLRGYGTGWLGQLRAQADLGHDPLIDVNYELPSYIHTPFCGSYLDLPDVSVEITVENQGGLNVVRRRFRTPAGDLSDVIVMARPNVGYGGSPTPERRENLVKEPRDVDRLRFLLPDPQHFSHTNWREIQEIIGERGILQVHPRPGLEFNRLVTDSLGIANCMIAFYEDRAMFDHLLHIIAGYFERLTRAMCEQGAPIVFVSWHDFGVSAGWSPRIYREAFKPLIKSNVDLVHSYGRLYHYFDHGKIMPILPDIGEMGVDIYSALCPPPVADGDMTEAKRLIAGQTCINGNIDVIYVLQRGMPEQVREVVRQVIVHGAPGGGFILGTSDAVLDGTPQENIDAYFGAAREFGRYPISL
jgi:hypothetical protein